MAESPCTLITFNSYSGSIWTERRLNICRPLWVKHWYTHMGHVMQTGQFNYGKGIWSLWTKRVARFKRLIYHHQGLSYANGGIRYPDCFPEVTHHSFLEIWVIKLIRNSLEKESCIIREHSLLLLFTVSSLSRTKRVSNDLHIILDHVVSWLKEGQVYLHFLFNPALRIISDSSQPVGQRTKTKKEESCLVYTPDSICTDGDSTSRQKDGRREKESQRERGGRVRERVTERGRRRERAAFHIEQSSANWPTGSHPGLWPSTALNSTQGDLG
jgi:hypothetical protein